MMIAVFALACTLQAAELGIRDEPGKVFVEVDGKPLATYHYRDGKILRPFFTDIHAPNGVAVTRNFPPVEGVDRTDHADMHPGLWLAFGRLGGADFWRNRARVEHVRFVSEPAADGNRAGFTVLNRYVTGGKVICEEICRVDIEMRPSGYFLIHDSVFRSDRADFAFGDQQEMGLGVRVTAPLVVKEGGRMLDSRGRRDEEEIWGQLRTGATTAARSETPG